MMEPSAPKIDVSRLTEREMWQAFAPQLHIGESRDRMVAMAPLDPVKGAAIQEQFKTEGYLHASGVDWGVDINLLAQTVLALSAAGVPPVFAFVYDEFWLPFMRLKPMHELLLGDYAMCPEVWVWNVDPKKNASGWPPHREKGRVALFPDHSPKALSTWIPLSNATPLNSCMYVLPAMHDPVYGTENEDKWDIAPAKIRALPAKPGDFLMWTQAVLHWGSQSSPRATENRISMAIEFQKADVPAFREPLLDPHRILRFESRLALIARQFHQYKHMDASPEFQAVVHALEEQLELSYVD